MKILSIKLKNLASIEGVFEIDFTKEPLASAGIFAISGSTGAGKSTILDALCLPLYDKTPRYTASAEDLYLHDTGDNQVNQNDVRNILRRSTGDGYAEVVFEAIDGKQYRSTWSVERIQKKPDGALQPQEIQLVEIKTGKQFQGTKKETLSRLVRLIGLSYEQFTRTVLLAQNDFSTFLKSRESQKAELLEKLTGTEIYSQISRSVYLKNKSVHEEIALLRQSLKHIELLPEDKLTAFLVEREQIKPQKEYANKQLMVLNDQLRIITVFKQQSELLNSKKQEIDKQKQEFTVVFAQQEKLNKEYIEFRKHCEALEPEFALAGELETKITETGNKLAKHREFFENLHLEREEFEKKLANKEIALSNELAWVNNHYSAETNDDKLIELSSLEQRESEKLAKMCAENDELLNKINKYGISNLGSEQNKIISEQKQLQQARLETLSWIGLQKESERLTKELQEQHAQLHTQEKNLASFQQQLDGKIERVKTLEKLYENARVRMSKDVQTLRENLTTGEPCPVCGSTAHPYKTDDISNSLYASIEQEYKFYLEDYQQTNNQYIAVGRDIQNLREVCNTLTNQLSALEAEVERKSPSSEEERSVKYYDSKLDLLNTQQTEILNSLTAYQELYGKWQQVDEEIKKQRIFCDALKSSLSSCKLMLQDLNSEKEKLALLIKAENKEEEHVVEAEKMLESLKAERAKLLDGKIVQEVKESISEQESEWLRKLETNRRDLDKCNTAYLILEGEIKQLSITVEALQAEHENIDKPEDLPEIIAQQKSIIEELEARYTYIVTQLNRQEENKVQHQKIKNDIEKKQIIAEKWEKLNWLIGSSDGAKFKIIAQSYTLNLLLMHANKHLSYLSKRYRLQQIPDTLALQIIDGEMGDEVRTIYSLSGGESFLISLALALGLSSLSSNNLKVESLFIDEGFGSLDSDSLIVAMDALEQLRFQGRKIGVISHVQEMSDRIPVKIQVTKGSYGRSQIKIIG